MKRKADLENQLLKKDEPAPADVNDSKKKTQKKAPAKGGKKGKGQSDEP